MAATTACAQGFEDGNHPSLLAYQVWSPLMVEWYGIIDQVEEADEVIEGTQHFSECTREAGIDAEYTESLGGFLGYTDSLIAQASEADDIALISERLGRLYARCATAYFEARETLLTGQLRTDFLDRNSSRLTVLQGLVNELD